MDSLRLIFNSSLSDIVSCNDSFDTASMRIAYHGDNRNGSHIDKGVFEKCAATMFNVPVVANYIREDDTIGSHDVEIVEKNGGFTLVNKTHPVGVVPESAKYWWESVVEEDGVEHEYLCADILLWKRQEAYDALKENGITAQSMEISVNGSHKENGIMHIDDFQFTAFCLLGTAEPCFESAAVELFNKNEFSDELRCMLSEVPGAITKYMEGVTNKAMNEKLQLMVEYGLTIEDLDFELADFSIEELKEKFESLRAKEPEEANFSDGDTDPEGDADEASEESTEDDEDNEDDDDEDDNEDAPKKSDFALNSEIRSELRRQLSEQVIHREWGEYPRYYLLDFDESEAVIYCEDNAQKGITVRIDYAVNGDAVVIDYDSSKRVKCVYVDFVDTGAEAPVEEGAEMFARSVVAGATAKLAPELAELASLRQYKIDAEAEKRSAAEAALFNEFSDLDECEAFASLKANCAQFDIEALREKCFAIRGRMSTNFSRKQTAPTKVVLPVDNYTDRGYVPYGGIVEGYRNR